MKIRNFIQYLKWYICCITICVFLPPERAHWSRGGHHAGHLRGRPRDCRAAARGGWPLPLLGQGHWVWHWEHNTELGRGAGTGAPEGGRGARGVAGATPCQVHQSRCVAAAQWWESSPAGPCLCCVVSVEARLDTQWHVLVLLWHTVVLLSSDWFCPPQAPEASLSKMLLLSLKRYNRNFQTEITN